MSDTKDLVQRLRDPSQIVSWRVADQTMVEAADTIERLTAERDALLFWIEELGVGREACLGEALEQLERLTRMLHDEGRTLLDLAPAMRLIARAKGKSTFGLDWMDVFN